jgi:hypothetical protein
MRFVTSFFLAFSIFLVSPGSEAASGISPFTSDFCTGFPEGTRRRPDLWKHCCIEHDLYFWVGGCRNARREADRRIRECIRDSGAPGVAWIMYAGIKLGALSPIKIKKGRWGNGWKDGRGDYRPLNETDLPIIEESLRENPPDGLEPAIISRFLHSLRTQACRTGSDFSEDSP